MTHQQQSVDIVTEHYAEQLERLIDENRYEDADAIFTEFVMDSVDPNDGKYEWTFINDLTNDDA